MLYPCLCLCFWLLQMIRTTPWRRTTLHLTQIFLTDDLTFTAPLLEPQRKLLILPRCPASASRLPHDAARGVAVVRGDSSTTHRVARQQAAAAPAAAGDVRP